MTTEEAWGKLNLSTDLIPEGASNRPGTELHPTKITIHNTDNDSPGANARAHAQYQKGADARQRKVSWHFTVDDQNVYQSLPVSERGWHSGASGNAASIGIELCQNADGNEAATNDRGALLTAVLAFEHGIEIASGLVQHNHWTGKNCPGRLRAQTGGWSAFKQKASEYLQLITNDGEDECTACILPDLPVISVQGDLPAIIGDLGRYSPSFLKLVTIYRKAPIRFPGLKAVTLAQWILESGRGKSRLAEIARNFGGLKWREEMTGMAQPVPYTDHAGESENYCAFPDLSAFILGYWHFLGREVYDGWEEHAEDPQGFMRYISGKGFNPQPEYPDEKVLPLLPEATALLEELPLEADNLGPPDPQPPPITEVLPPLEVATPPPPTGPKPYLVKFFTGDYGPRQRAANADGAVAYVEQHFNSGLSSDGYSVSIVATNASVKSKEWGRAYAHAIAEEFGCRVGGDDGIKVGGFNGRGNANLYQTNMPAILLEPLFASDPAQAEIIRSESGQLRLAKKLVETIRKFFPDGGLIAFSVGHKYKTSSPNDRGVDLAGGGFEADYAELVLQKARDLLVIVEEG